MQISTLIKQAKVYLPKLDEKRFKRAYVFARNAHAGQKRMDGSEYITHPMEVTSILTHLRVDETTLLAAILHDVPEDTKRTIEEVEKEFGRDLAFLVSGVTKLSKMKYRHNMVERQVDSLKKFFLHSARDLRIILIKLADRLHNMRTLNYVRQEKQLRIAKETMEIYVPIANLLGVWEVKSELENLCFAYIYPKEYDQLKHLIQKTAAYQQKILKGTTQKLQRELKKNRIQAEIQSRPKSLYSIFRKMVDREQQVEDLNDLLAIRVIVKERDDCYRVLGLIHELFRPKSGRIKDYIAVPKANGYQSLHTTVFGVDGTPTEFQIRTQEMHIESEYGIAAHYFYKEGSSARWTKIQREIKKRSGWVKEVLELQKDLKSNTDFIENLKIDVLQDRIFVFTPHGDMIDLPQGATGLDFAYHIHTDVGDHAVGLSRNGQSYPLTFVLETGDTVKIMTSKTQTLPKREWLEKVKTNLARNKIRLALKRQTQEQAYEAGVEFLTREFHLYGEKLDRLSEKQKDLLLAAFEMKNWREFIEAVGNGTISESEIISLLYSTEDLLGTPHRTGHDYSINTNKIGYRKSGTRLFTPVNSSTTPFYRVSLSMECNDRVGLLRDLGIEFAKLGVNIYQIGVRPTKVLERVKVDLIIEVMDLDQLRNAFDAMEGIDGIIEFHRIAAS